jgi:hypothetical protein
LDECKDHLRVGGQANADDLAALAEEFADGVLVNAERQVADEEGVALGADGIAMLLSTVEGTGLGSRVGRAAVGIVEVEGTAIEVLAIHSLVGNLSLLTSGEVDVAKALAAASVLVVNDTSANETLKGLESLVEVIVIDAPAQATREQGAGNIVIGLGLLGGRVDLLVGLALLGRSSLSLSLLLIGLGIVRVILGVILRIVGVLEMGQNCCTVEKE